MIAYLQGSVLEYLEDGLIVSVHGVGYEVHCPKGVLDTVAAGQNCALWIHTHVREDALQLYGFLKKKERDLFLSLIKVSGIGPKSAIHILSATTFAELLELIERGDAKGLAKLPKVGKKTAEQMILALKGHLPSAAVTESVRVLPLTPRDSIISALLHLGFRMNEVTTAVDQLDSDIDVQEGVRKSLALLNQSFNR